MVTNNQGGHDVPLPDDLRKLLLTLSQRLCVPPAELDDLIHSVLLRFDLREWESNKILRRRDGPTNPILSPPGYLFIVLRNEYRKFCSPQRLKRRFISSEEFENLIDPNFDSAENRITSVECQAAIQSALGALTERQRTFIELHFWEERSKTEIAQIFECSVANVSHILDAAYAKLRHHLPSSLYLDL